MLLAQLHGLPDREGPRLEAQLTLPLSTISFCRLVDVVTRSRMACQDPDIRHSWGGHPSCRARPPLGPQLAAHLHQVSAGVEDPVGGRKGERGACSVAPDAAGLVGEQGWPLCGQPWGLTLGAWQCGPKRRMHGAPHPSWTAERPGGQNPAPGSQGNPPRPGAEERSPLIHLQFHPGAGVAGLVHHVLHQ